MTARSHRRRGEPLVALAAILLGWGGARLAVWQTAHRAVATVPRPAARPVLPGVLAASAVPAIGATRRPPVPVGGLRRSRIETPNGPGPFRPILAVLPDPVRGGSFPVPSRPPPTVSLAAPPASAGATSPASPPAGSPPSPASAAPRRWSVDAWALVRRGGGIVAATPSLATYGASQVGAVLRYRLLTADPHRPVAYLRATAALNGSREREAALGLSVRPIANVPVTVGGEGRISRLSAGTVLRPAVLAVTEFAPIALARGALAEFYLQGGYVGGAGATPFIDGQARIDKRVFRFGPADLRVGAGGWGGAQSGTSRLDVGPSATLALARGATALRVGLDWRFRIAGSARPASGPALTVSAGF